MTRQFNQQVHCPNCQTWISHETSFGRWIRNNKEIDSRKGYCVVDQDYIIHKFKTHGGKDFQLLMIVEIKTMGSALTEAQRDTLNMVNQLMRNRKNTNLNFQAGRGIVHVLSTLNKKKCILRAYGMHVLTFSGLGPDDSEWMKWDKKEIDESVLTRLLKFELDPDTLKEIDLRQHHKKSTITEKVIDPRWGTEYEKTIVKQS